MPAQLKGKVSDEEHRSEQDPIDHLVRREKYILVGNIFKYGLLLIDFLF